MTLKEFCTILQQCANTLEEEIKYNINDVHNLIYSHRLNETKMSLEKAKDYHYKEIIDGIGEILKSIRKILFHQGQVEWLSDENNFTKDELRRFSYVKRQVYAFSNTDEVARTPSPNLTKKEKYRTSSEMSAGSLEIWEKYLDQKEIEIEEKIVEQKPLVPKRTLSNARRRKKYVSSTFGGFLEGDERRRNLDSIFEDDSSTEENERLSFSMSLDSLNQMAVSDERNESSFGKSKHVTFGRSLESLHNMASRSEGYVDNGDSKKGEDVKEIEININDKEHKSLDNTIKDPQIDCGIIKIINESVPKSKHVTFGRSLESLHNMASSSEGCVDNGDSKKGEDVEEIEININDKEHTSLDNTIKDPQIDCGIIKIINESVPKGNDSMMNEIMDSFLNDTSTPVNATYNDNLTDHSKEMIKPKIVDVIYKKKPS